MSILPTTDLRSLIALPTPSVDSSSATATACAAMRASTFSSGFDWASRRSATVFSDSASASSICCRGGFFLVVDAFSAITSSLV